MADARYVANYTSRFVITPKTETIWRIWNAPFSIKRVPDWVGVVEPTDEPPSHWLWVPGAVVEAVKADRQRVDLLLAARNAECEARRAKRRAQKAHSKACRLRWMADR